MMLFWSWCWLCLEFGCCRGCAVWYCMCTVPDLLIFVHRFTGSESAVRRVKSAIELTLTTCLWGWSYLDCWFSWTAWRVPVRRWVFHVLPVLDTCLLQHCPDLPIGVSPDPDSCHRCYDEVVSAILNTTTCSCDSACRFRLWCHFMSSRYSWGFLIQAAGRLGEEISSTAVLILLTCTFHLSSPAVSITRCVFYRLLTMFIFRLYSTQLTVHRVQGVYQSIEVAPDWGHLHLRSCESW